MSCKINSPDRRYTVKKSLLFYKEIGGQPVLPTGGYFTINICYFNKYYYFKIPKNLSKLEVAVKCLF